MSASDPVIGAFANQNPEDAVLEKFTTKGFNKLSLEELALTQVTTSWKEDFQRATGENWDQYQAKAVERLRRANFDMKWLTKRTDNAFLPLLTAVVRGDIARVTEYIRINDLPTCQEAVDDTKKTCLHLAAREGHLELVELFLGKGWSVDARDRLLNTPLHLACYRGHSKVAQALLKRRADLQAGDSSGRKAAHYACSANDSDTLKVLLTQDREIVQNVDNTGRGLMHYAVFNNSARQIDFIRVLLEYGCAVDQTDSLGRTPLHYACEAARSRCIPMLLKNGAQLTTKDKSGKTPVDLVKNEQIHQVIALYVHPEGGEMMEQGAGNPYGKGKPAPKTVLPPASQGSPSKTRVRVSQSEPVTQLPIAKQERRETLINLLRRIQEAGVNGQQHLKKPQIFSGSWMEGISTPPALLHALASCLSAEAVLRVFNVLYPYPKQLPMPQGDEGAIYEFYGEAWSGNSDPIIVETAEEQVEERPIDRKQIVVQDDRKVKELEAHISAQDKELFRLRKELQASERKCKDLERQVPLQEHLTSMEGERDQAIQIKEKLQKEFLSLKQQHEALKVAHETIAKTADTAPKAEELDRIKKDLAEKDAKDRALRFKSGLLFLKSLDAKEETSAADPQIHLQDGQVIERLAAMLESSKPSLKQRLSDVDMNADGSVTKSELTKAMDKLGLTPQDILSLLRIAGFRPGVNSIPIKAFTQLIDTWEAKKSVLISQLFAKIKEKFKGKPLEDIFSMLDINHDGKISFTEFGDAVNMLKLNMSREERHSIFAVLDQDHCGAISLEELKTEIEAAKDVPREATKEEVPEAQKDEEGNEYDEELELNDKDEEEGEEPPPEEDVEEETPERESPIDDPDIPVVPTKQPTISKPINPVIKKEIPPNPAKPASFKPKEEKPVKISSPVASPSPVISSKSLSGRLSLQLVKGREIGPGKYALQCTLPGSDGPQRTEFAQGPAPEWKFRGRFKFENAKIAGVPENVKIELFGASGVEATVQVPWIKALSQAGNWAVNSEFPLKDAKTGKGRGFVLVQMKWIPKDILRLEASGDLYIQPINALQLTNCLLFFSLAGITARTAKSGPPWSETLTLQDIQLSATKPIPALQVQVLSASTQQAIVQSSFNWETVLASPNQFSTDIKMSLSSKQNLVLKMKWRPFTEEEELQAKYAKKIQAWWRGKKSRDRVTKIKELPRKIIDRKGVKVGDRFYLINLYQDPNNKVKAELNPVGDPTIPMYTLLDSLEIDPEQAGDVQVSPEGKIVLGKTSGEAQTTAGPDLRGDLGFKVTSTSGLTNVMLKVLIGSAFAHSLAGPPWPRPMLLQNVSTSRNKTEVSITVIELASRKELSQTKSDFRGCLGAPNSWSPDVLVDFGTGGKLQIQYQWQPYPETNSNKEAAAVKLQAAFKGKKARNQIAASQQKQRKLVGRRGVKSKTGKYYLIAFYQEDDGVGIALHQTSDPAVPMYEEVDYIKSTTGADISQLQERVTVSDAGKLSL